MNFNFTAFLTLLPLLCMSNPFAMHMAFGQLGKLRNEIGPDNFAAKMDSIKRQLEGNLEQQLEKRPAPPQIVQVIRTRERMIVDQNNKPVDYAANVRRAMYQVTPSNGIGAPARIRRIMKTNMKIIPKEHSKMVENMDADKFIGMSREDIKKFRHKMEALSAGTSTNDSIADEKKARRKRMLRSLVLGFSAAATLYGIAFVVLYALSVIIEKSTSSSSAGDDIEDGKNEKMIIAATEELKKDVSQTKDIDHLIE